MLPQKKNLLRRNAWYRQQLQQLATPHPASAADSDHKHNSSFNERASSTTANKPIAAS